MRFLHAADVHLDSPCSSRSETVRQRLREASRLAFRRLVDLSLSEHVDVVLIAVLRSSTPRETMIRDVRDCAPSNCPGRAT
jgi:uncharacterized protein with PhoU and TrkA domain